MTVEGSAQKRRHIHRRRAQGHVACGQGDPAHRIAAHAAHDFVEIRAQDLCTLRKSGEHGSLGRRRRRGTKRIAHVVLGQATEHHRGFFENRIELVVAGEHVALPQIVRHGHTQIPAIREPARQPHTQGLGQPVGRHLQTTRDRFHARGSERLHRRALHITGQREEP